MKTYQKTLRTAKTRLSLNCTAVQTEQCLSSSLEEEIT